MSATDVRTGLCQYLEWSLDGSTWFPFGIVPGGETGDAEAPEHRRGLGGFDRLVGPMVFPGGSVQFLPVDGTFITHALGYVFRPRTTYYPCTGLTEYYVRMGTASGAAGEEQYQYCKTNSLVLEAAVGDPLQATVEWLGRDKSEVVYDKPTQTLGDHFEWYDGVCTVNSTAVSLQGFTVTLENGLRPYTDMDGAVATELRLAKRLLEGNEAIRLDVRCGNPLTLAARGAVADDLPVNLTANFAFTNTEADVLTIAVTGLANVSKGTPAQGDDGEVIHSYSFEAADNAQALAVTFV